MHKNELRKYTINKDGKAKNCVIMRLEQNI